MELGASKEDYLESIYRLGNRGKNPARVIDIAKDMNVAKSSASLAVKCLEHMKYVERGAEFEVYLTSKGQKLGKILYERHRFWKHLLVEIGITNETAEREASEIEHVLSEESFQTLKKYLETTM